MASNVGSRKLIIENRQISTDLPTFIVAELSCNHTQNFDIAVKTIRAAAASGADAIKLQTFTPDTITLDCDKQCFQINQGTLWDGKSLYQLYKDACTPWEWHEPLQKIAHEEGLVFFSSPFDNSAVDLLVDLKTPAFKIASFEITDIPLIEYVASKGKPVIISTGIARADDIQLAVDAVRKQANDQIVLLKCTSSYPAPLAEANLLTMCDLGERYSTLFGLSDHTPGNIAAVVAASLGASIIEKHFILDKNLPSADKGFSLDPSEFAELVKQVRAAESCLGQVTYELSPQVTRNREFARSLFASQDIAAGETLSIANVRSVRPGFGLPPKELPIVLGCRAKKPIPFGTPLSWDLIDDA